MEHLLPAEKPDLSSAETLKDTAQVLTETGVGHIGKIMSIVTDAVRDIAHEVGELATDGFEMFEAGRRARGRE